jgi:hypothetical protein
MKFFQLTIDTLKRLLTSTVRPDVVSRLVDQQPANRALEPGVLYIVSGGPTPKWAIMQCPCGCNEKLQLSLNPTRRPRWSVHRDRLRRVTVDPSVRQTGGCRAHFWIRRGMIEWCRDSGRDSTA